MGHINIDRRLLTPEKFSGLHGKLRGKFPMDPPSFYAYVAASKLGTMASVARFPHDAVCTLSMVCPFVYVPYRETRLGSFDYNISFLLHAPHLKNTANTRVLTNSFNFSNLTSFSHFVIAL